MSRRPGGEYPAHSSVVLANRLSEIKILPVHDGVKHRSSERGGGNMAMKRLGLAILAFGMMGAGWAIQALVDRRPAVGGGGGVGESGFMRSIEELKSFRALLQDAGVQAELHDICGTVLHLGFVVNSTIPARSDESCQASEATVESSRILHSLVFIESVEPISRALVVDYSTCKRGEADYAIALERQYFSSAFQRPAAPIFTDTRGLAVFAKAFEPDGVVGKLEIILAARPIASVRTLQTSQSETSGRIHFVFEAWAGEPENSPPTLALRARAYYDLQTGTAVFE